MFERTELLGNATRVDMTVKAVKRQYSRVTRDHWVTSIHGANHITIESVTHTDDLLKDLKVAVANKETVRFYR